MIPQPARHLTVQGEAPLLRKMMSNSYHLLEYTDDLLPFIPATQNHEWNSPAAHTKTPVRLCASVSLWFSTAHRVNCDQESIELVDQTPKVDDMSAPRVRPRFEIEVAGDPDDLMQRLRERLPGCPNCTGCSVGRHAELFVPEAERRLWSPYLSVTAYERNGGSMLRGRFAPHPSLWTFYLFLAFAAGFAILVGTAWGYAQWATEATPWALTIVAAALVLGAALCLASQIGQRLGAEQMTRLRAALEEPIQT